MGECSPPPTAVAIPAREEAEHIDACLAALAAQVDGHGAPLPRSAFEVLVLVNNSGDDTADRARAHGSRLRLKVRQVELPPGQAHAGGARRAAMDWARSRLLGTDGVICTTDADSRVAPDWLWRTWRALALGVDAVAGVIAFDPEQAQSLRLPPSRRLESRYAALQAEVDAAFDPDPCNPWPNHIWAWGASLAVTQGAYVGVGGAPCVPLAEDRALVAALKAQGRRVRHCPDVRVVTSCRRIGRAPGGLADLISAYEADAPGTACDAALEPIIVTQRRALLRRQARLGGAAGLRAFEAAWAAVELEHPALRRRRLHTHELPLEIARAEALLRQAREADPGDTAAPACAGPW